MLNDDVFDQSKTKLWIYSHPQNQTKIKCSEKFSKHPQNQYDFEAIDTPHPRVEYKFVSCSLIMMMIYTPMSNMELEVYLYHHSKPFPQIPTHIIEAKIGLWLPLLIAFGISQIIGDTRSISRT